MDLSRSGLGLALEAPHPDGVGRLEAEFRLPGFLLPLLVGARVAWSDAGSGRLGLAFAGVEADVVELLESFVAGRFADG